MIVVSNAVGSAKLAGEAHAEAHTEAHAEAHALMTFLTLLISRCHFCYYSYLNHPVFRTGSTDCDWALVSDNFFASFFITFFTSPPPFAETLVGKWSLDRSRTIMVGDRLDTDVVFGNRAGIATAFNALSLTPAHGP